MSENQETLTIWVETKNLYKKIADDTMKQLVSTVSMRQKTIKKFQQTFGK